MSTEKTINTRIKLKRDTEANWEAAKDKTILNGEVILVDTSDGRLRAKIGGKNTTYEQLEFIDNIHIITADNVEEEIPANAIIVVDTTEEDMTSGGSGYFPYVTPQMFGAIGDGVTDDTEAIQQALDASSYVYIPDGTYMINAYRAGWTDPENGGIFPRSNQTIILSNNALLKAITNPTGFYNVINIVDVENVHIKGGKIQGERTTHTDTKNEHGYGIHIIGSKNITVEQMEVYECWGDSIIVGYFGEVNSDRVNIYNCKLHSSRRQGISIVGGTNVTIRDCEIYNISGTDPQYGIDIEPDGDYGIAKNILIDNCYLHDNAKGSIVIANVTNEIRGVNITNCTLDDVNSVGGSEVRISDCDIGTMFFGAEETVSVSDSTIKIIYLYGATGLLNGCNIIGGIEDHLIMSSRDGFPNKPKSNLICNNCRFTTHDSARYVMYMVNGDETNGQPDDTFVFTNCMFEIGANCYFSSRFAGEETRFDSCTIVYKWEAYELFTINNIQDNRLVLRNTEVRSDGTPMYIISVSSNSIVNIDISNCKFPNTKNFMYCGDNTSGKVWLFNNEMSTVNLVGTHSFETFICNSVDTEPTEGSTNLITSGAVKAAISNFLTLDDLPIYNGGVS